MKPIRRKETREVAYDPATGHDQILELSGGEDTLSDQGSVDSIKFRRKFFRACGCDAEIGGRCKECGAISCIACHGRCHRCKKPICLEHSAFLVETESIEGTRLCNRCYGEVTRKQKWTKVGRFLLSTIVREEQEDE